MSSDVKSFFYCKLFMLAFAGGCIVGKVYADTKSSEPFQWKSSVNIYLIVAAITRLSNTSLQIL